MKRILALAVLALSVFLFTSCGSAGDTTLTVTGSTDNGYYDWINIGIPFGGLPPGWAFDTPYGITPDTYVGSYIAIDLETGWIHDVDGWYGPYAGFTASDVAANYRASVKSLYGGDGYQYYIGVDYTIDPYYGFFPGMTGVQRDWTLTLTATGANSPFSSNIAGGRAMATSAPKASVEHADISIPVR